MRVAAIYDIHGNLSALEAVLDEIRNANVDLVIVGGDVIPGPLPKETLRCLLDLSIPTKFLFGNGEVAVLEQMAGREPTAVPQQFRSIIEWTALQIREYEQVFANWPKTLHVDIPDFGDVLFCHATPSHENEIFTRLTDESLLLPVFANLGITLVVCGHTHMQFDRMVGGTRVVNAGSVGMPFGAPGADWLLLAPEVQLKHMSYDLVRAAGQIRESNYPDAEGFIKNSLLQPPSEAAMLKAFAPAELKYGGL